MNKSAAISNMQSSIIQYIRNNLPKDENNARTGTIRGNRVLIGNKSYSYNTAVDMAIFDGDTVYCLIPNSGNTAAVVGQS